jgi:hypothetical protein
MLYRDEEKIGQQIEGKVGLRKIFKMIKEQHGLNVIGMVQ